MRIEFNLTSPDIFHKALNQDIPSIIKGNQLIIDKSFGEGGMKYLELQHGLYVNQIDAKVNSPLTLHRLPKNKNDYFILNFHLSSSDIRQDIGGKIYKLGFENINVLLSSACAEAKLEIPASVPIKLFNIGFTIDWLEENILSFKTEEFFSLFRSNKSIYLFETIDYQYKKKLLLTDFENKSKLSIMSGTMQLLDYFFQKVSARNVEANSHQNIDLTEFATMQRIREEIDNCVSSTISVEKLSKMAGMSLSKFKLLFKQIFGTTPYQYYLTNRMERAMELLESKKYSVSEVGYIIGYSNLSQFTKAFHKHFGILPSDIK